MPKFKKRVISKTILREKRRKIKFAKCAICKKPLHGTKRLEVNELKKLSKSEKRPERPYGGYLCSECAKELFKQKARNIMVS